MAELIARPDPELTRRQAFAVVLGSRIRSQLTYRSNFVINFVASFVLGLVEFSEIYILLHNSPVLGGLNLLQAALVFALANVGFCFADLVFGQVDRTPDHIRLGTLESFLTRPLPLLTQLITADFQLRRLGRALFALIVLVVVVVLSDLDLTPATTYLLIATPIWGAVIYGGLFVMAGGVQFYVVDGSEFTNSVVYGGGYAGQLPGSVLLVPLRVAFTFVFPATVTAYLPALVVLGLPGPALLPAWLGWWAPVFGLWTWLLAMLAWRSGLRHYTGAGG